MPAVIQVVEKGGQYQIVIGTRAKDVYEGLTRLISIDTSQQPEVKQSLANRVIAIMPAVFAPFDCKIASVFETRHAICLETDSGAELLIHIGLDTAKSTRSVCGIRSRRCMSAMSCRCSSWKTVSARSTSASPTIPATMITVSIICGRILRK